MTATTTPSVPAGPNGNPVTASKATFTLNFALSGQITGHMTNARADGSLCQRRNAPLGAVFTGDVNGQATAVQVIIPAVAGFTHAVIVVSRSNGQFSSPPTGPSGANLVAWSTYHGSAVVDADGVSASIQGDLEAVGGPVQEHISGSWKCQLTPTSADGLGPFTCSLPFNRAPSGGALAQPTTARVAAQPGYDRIVFEYAGKGLPDLSITSATPPFTLDAKGGTVPVSGKVFLRIFFRSVLTGYSGPHSFKAALPVLTDLELTGDFEGFFQWVAGLSGPACVREFTLTNPSRLVIDLESSAAPSLPKSGQKPSNNTP